MAETFEAKVRNVGTSLGVLIPREVVEEMKLKRGQKVRIGILKEDPKTISKYFGIDKEAKSFRRYHGHRD